MPRGNGGYGRAKEEQPVKEEVLKKGRKRKMTKSCNMVGGNGAGEKKSGAELKNEQQLENEK